MLRHQLGSPEEEAFAAAGQARWIIGIAAMALALGIRSSWPGMLSPIRSMHDNVSKLSVDYSIQLSSHRADELGDLMRNLDRPAVTLDPEP